MNLSFENISNALILSEEIRASCFHALPYIELSTPHIGLLGPKSDYDHMCLITCMKVVTCMTICKTKHKDSLG